MKISNLFLKTEKEMPRDSDSINASFLVRAGYVQKQMAGVYSLLPLGLKVVRKIEDIVREEMDSVSGQEILMNVLQPKDLWSETGRWDKVSEVMYHVGSDIGLAPTHEEQVTDIVRKKVSSYKNLPLSLYQIQTKFRNEPRAKSGLLRGREFIMKDMYSFHSSDEDFNLYYKNVAGAYKRIFSRIDLETKFVSASGGMFSEYSDEFQVVCKTGEDTIYFCESCDFAENKEISKLNSSSKCPKCGGNIREEKSIEVGNIFPLGTKYSKAMGAKFIDSEGKEKDLVMGCYGLGITRTFATLIELFFNQEKNKMTWPKSVAPFSVEIISLKKNEEAEKLYQKLFEKNIEVLYDDRELSAGEKFADADLIGAPTRIIISEKSLISGGAEIIDLKSGRTTKVAVEDIIKKLV